jgi:hypothetical protein
MRIVPRFLISTCLACFVLSGCVSIRDGVVVSKRARSGMPDVYAEQVSWFRYEPSVYWVQVKGKDDKGRERIKNIILFRHDWNQLRVGDHWSKQHGFSPAEAEK